MKPTTLILIILTVALSLSGCVTKDNAFGETTPIDDLKDTKPYEVVKFQLPNGNSAHHEIKTFEYFKEYYRPDTDIKIIEADYDKYVKSFEPDFIDSRLNVSYEVLRVDYTYTENQIKYEIFYLDNNEIKYIKLPYRYKLHRDSRADRIDEHLITGYTSTNNKSTLTLKVINFEHYPVTDDGFNVYKWELLLSQN